MFKQIKLRNFNCIHLFKLVIDPISRIIELLLLFLPFNSDKSWVSLVGRFPLILVSLPLLLKPLLRYPLLLRGGIDYARLELGFSFRYHEVH